MTKRVSLAAAMWLVGCGEPPPRAEASTAAIPTESALTQADCERCHSEVAASWARSRHRHAFDNADFQRAYKDEPKPFCRNCHAPGGSGAQARGVGCLDCHGGDEGIVTGLGEGSQGPHTLDRTPDFGTATCARCHEFAFPPDSRRPKGTMMQRTMEEHEASPHADKSCATCHLPPTDVVGSRRLHDHSLGSTRDPNAMRQALQVTAKRDGNDLVVTLVPHEVGHAFPTGDLYRRLEIGAELHANGERIGSATRYLARHFAPWRLPSGALNPAFQWPVVDDRITEPTTIRLAIKSDVDSTDTALTWWVDYQRVDERHADAPGESSIADEIRLAAGTL